MNLNIFNTHSLFEAATNLFKELGITLNSNTALALPIKDLLQDHYKNNDTFNAIEKTYFIGKIDDSIFKNTGIFDVQYSYNEVLKQDDKYYEGLILFALELNKQPSKSEISTLTRAFNRISKNLPVALLLKYDINNSAVISIAISERFMYKQNWQQGEKTGKVIILKDIHTINTHAGHLRILLDLVKPNSVNNYSELHKRWLEVLDVSVLNKKFFKELANWYFGAMDNVSFPDDIEKQKELRNATNLIRLITRIIFIWFIKEKSLVPNLLFNKSYLDKVLKDFNKNNKSKNYYNAILQNLFFGTLNQKVNERKFAQDGDIHTNKKEFFVKNIYRYANLFNISNNEVINLFKDVPFLNGGLFDCLDKENEQGSWVYIDGYSRNPSKQAIVPDYIFFGEETEIDLNDIYATKNKKYKTKGLINILESYKFTVTENTPIEEEIALDPELLGKVFENLLASYNPETKTTARKQTGSFYTPREIVNYMVDESLLEYIKQNVKNESENFETRLRNLFSYSNDYNPFNETETYAIIEAINKCKILDPACGSGAYPMGILHKMVYLLQKLDPDNQYWKALQRQKAIEETETAFNIGNKAERDFRLKEISDVFENNASDYGRKLYLIENCIYGIDIQPIAVQISKLRFFISLIIDQKPNPNNTDNFGIRSLPNLETKFVAANTLIGLDKPQQTLLRNPNIEIKENELKVLRHKYFTANTRKEKIDLQNQDHTLRMEIVAMLKTDGWDTQVAKQIASFDPYNQNIFANWFDPEWMFGLKQEKSKIKPKSVEIDNLNNQIEVINKQIEVLNHSLKNNLNESIIILQFINTDNQINTIKQEINFVKTIIEKLSGQVNTPVNEIVSEPANFSFAINSLNQRIKKLNLQIEDVNKKLRKNIQPGEYFDIVIGNPPYLNVEEINKSIKENISKFKTAYQKYDLYVLFYEKGIDLLNKNGQLNFITSNKFLSQGYGLKLRQLFLKYTIIEIINFNYDVFENATVRTCIFNFRKQQAEESHKIKVIDINSKSDENKFISNLYTYIKQTLFNETDENNFRINLTEEKIELINIIKNNCIKVEEICSVNYGLRPSSEKLNLKKKAFIYNSNTKNDFKPYFEGKDMGFWKINKSVFIEYKPEVMYNPMFTELFEKEKLVGIRTTQDVSKHRFIHDDNGYYCNDSVVILTLWHLFENVKFVSIKNKINNDKIIISKEFDYKYLQAILNSKLIKFYFKELMHDGLHFYPNHMKVLPIKKYGMKEQKIFTIVVNYLHNLSKIDPEIKSLLSANKSIISYLEALLNAMVYEIYLPEEVKAGGADVLKYLIKLPELQEGQEDKNLKTIEKVYKELSDQKHPVCIALLKIKEIQEIKIIEGAK